MNFFKAGYARLGVWLTLFGAIGTEASACAVCFGDSDSAMARGAAAGVMFLAGVVGFVFLGIGATTLFWFRRSQLLMRQEEFSACQKT